MLRLRPLKEWTAVKELCRKLQVRTLVLNVHIGRCFTPLLCPSQKESIVNSAPLYALLVDFAVADGDTTTALKVRVCQPSLVLFPVSELTRVHVSRFLAQLCNALRTIIDSTRAAYWAFRITQISNGTATDTATASGAGGGAGATAGTGAATTTATTAATGASTEAAKPSATTDPS